MFFQDSMIAGVRRKLQDPFYAAPSTAWVAARRRSSHLASSCGSSASTPCASSFSRDVSTFSRIRRVKQRKWKSSASPEQWKHVLAVAAFSRPHVQVL